MEQKIIHTGQHYDDKMYEVFFKQLEIPTPDYNLGVGSSSHAHQTAEMMIRIEEVFIRERPDMIIVYGDVNSTLAGALVASKMGIKIAHIEAGLRSFDRTMPEEINRIVTDSISDYCFTPSEDANQHLKNEGIESDKIFLVRNIMIDTMVKFMTQIEQCNRVVDIENYVLCTLHRPSNVEDKEALIKLIDTFEGLSEIVEIIFPLHPRTRKRLAQIDIDIKRFDKIHFIEPLGYFEFIKLQKEAKIVITDSGGIQEESTFLGVPCLTLRENTERPITISEGTNQLIGHDYETLKSSVIRILKNENSNRKVPNNWDGQTAKRIVNYLLDLL
ncbi:UDP-N-acetylglucosamine 2-epimerase (non-hydrolyzing) [Marivirga arenosa]|uniref:UDP-N-acetylglucosamine 2-epimerase (Non-hydrolyzing) n=1 Tax=Marivirga arenosa TaxID=3059076 RepID=A0AA51N8U5_9BACT|nr:UDP-N-acetylglucosamine 2-epimerase (non-hydrolyzing) [Marivirga sp. ABR2-2]WMN08069.1 UDP-N-acetylglucosamine 2-epimerase (non-hydrolyzing) [Marivirga sp. ABR2-2]